jgi:hypothetical protein
LTLPPSGLTGDTGGDPAEDCDAIDSATLIQAVDWLASNRNYIDSFQVHHCGEPLVEQFYNGYSDTTPHELRSATKTYTAVLGVGLALAPRSIPVAAPGSPRVAEGMELGTTQ